MATDAELQQLATDAVDPLNGGQYGNPLQNNPTPGVTQGIDLSQFDTPQQTAPISAEAVNAPAPVVPNGPADNGHVEAPGDRDMSAVAPAPHDAGPGSAAPGGTELTPEGGVRALNTARAADMATADAKLAEAPARVEQAQNDAAAQDQVAAEARNQAVEIQAQAQAQKDAVEAAQSKADAAMDGYKSFKLRDFWKDLDGGAAHGPERVKAAIYVALGAFNSDHHGGENQSLKQINTMIDQQHRADTTELNKRGKFAEWAQEGVKDMAGRYKEEMANLRFKQAAMSQAVADEAKAQLIRNGIPVLEAENNTLVKGLRAKAEQDYAKGYQSLVKDQAQLAMERAHLAISRAQLGIARDAAQDKPPTQAEGENASRGRNMQLAIDNLNKSGLADYKPDPKVVQKWLSNQEQIEAARERGKSLTGQVGNFAARTFGSGIPANEFDGLSPKDKEYFTLVRQVVEPYARKQSGAAISAGEWQNFANQIGPQSGARGKELREQAARDMLTLGGRATRQLEAKDAATGRVSPGKAEPKPSPPPAPQGRRVKYKGQPGTLSSDGTFTPD